MEGKKVLIGVCGSIAAYKSATLIRLLVKAGCQVKVVMTASAKAFITPLTLSTLSKNPVFSEFVKNDKGEWENHVELGLWADLMVVAPASANTLAKFARGICDNLLSAVYLSAKCPVMVAPAMDLDMYQHQSTQKNLLDLRSYDNLVLEAEYGELASGLVGSGRMVEPEQLVTEIDQHFKKKSRFSEKRVLITAGPTHERIDPVRFIGNNSSGKMGLALANAFAKQGARVHLIAGPGVQTVSSHNIEVTSVESADEMFDQVSRHFGKSDITLFAAAVADYRPQNIANEKIKKSDKSMSISLVRNRDIAYEMGGLKKNGQFNVGFALETENEHENAVRKMKKKNFDMIVLNSLRDNGAGFSGDTNKITIFRPDEKPLQYDLKSKDEVAHDILNEIYEKIS